MKKRIVATILAGAVVTAGVAGLTACGNGSVSVPKGEEVTAEKWEAAFSYTEIAKIENFTSAYSYSEQSSVKGTLKVPDYTNINPDTYEPGVKDSEVNATAKASANGTTLYAKDKDYAYTEVTASASGKGTVDKATSSLTAKYSGTDYYELKENKNDNKTYWNASRASYSTSLDSKSEEIKTSSNTSSESYWTAKERTSLMSSGIYSYVNDFSLSYGPTSTSILSKVYYDAKEEKNVKTEGTLDELYKLFKYENGVYTATLYTEIEIYEDIDVIVETNVTLSFDKDGKLIGYGEKINASDSVKEDKEYDIQYTYKVDVAYALSDIGTTDAAKKANNDVKKAIQKADEENK